MSFSENLDVFLADFGVDVTPSSGSGFRAILDYPDQVIEGGMILSTDYRLTAKTSGISGLAHGSSLAVDGGNYTVRHIRKLEDGRFSEILLSKV